MAEDAKLKYLFVAEYEDGSLHEQTPIDVSRTTEYGSAYTDVDQDRVVRFYLTDTKDVWMVDLRTGMFYHNVKPFGMWDEDKHIAKRQLVYFRRKWVELVVGAQGEMMDSTQKRTTFHLGWKGVDEEGNEVERTIWIE